MRTSLLISVPAQSTTCTYNPANPRKAYLELMALLIFIFKQRNFPKHRGPGGLQGQKSHMHVCNMTQSHGCTASAPALHWGRMC